MSDFNEDQKVKTLINAAHRDPDAASCFVFHSHKGGMVIIVKPQDVAEKLFKWLLNQGLTTENRIPEKTS